MNWRFATACRHLKTHRFIWLGLAAILILVVTLPPRRATSQLEPAPRPSTATQPVTSLLPPPTASPTQPEVLNRVAGEPIHHLPATNERDRALLDSIYEIARTKPVEALTWAMENAPATTAGDELIAHTAVQWAATDPQAASRWAEKVPDEELRAQLLTGIATAWGESDSLAAAELALRTLPAGRQQDDAVVGIVQRWVQTEPEAAATWVLDFPAGSLRETALENLVKIWADQDLPQATRWLTGLATGASRDQAVAVYVTEIAPSFPAVAWQWAATIGDATLRDHQLAALAETSDPEVN